MVKRYCGIGSRKTAPNLLLIMEQIGEDLAKLGYILHSGGAEGADQAFEVGCDKVNGPKQVFLPWKGFNSHTSPLYDIPEEAFYIAEEQHPAWNLCSQGAKKLHARNIQQILGLDLQTPVDFVICNTEGGELVGGTATAVSLANSLGIPVLNLGERNAMLTYQDRLKELTLAKEEV